MEKSSTIKFLSSGDTQNFPDITFEKFFQNYDKRSGLMEYKGEQYWKVIDSSMFISRTLTFYYKETKSTDQLVISYDLAKLIDYEFCSN